MSSMENSGRASKSSYRWQGRSKAPRKDQQKDQQKVQNQEVASSRDLATLIQQFQVHNQTEGKSPKTVLWYNAVLGTFYRWLESEKLPTQVGAMSEEVVRLFILHYQNRPGLKGPKMSTHSVANRVAGLKTFFGWLAQRGYTPGHLLEDIRLPKKTKLLIETLTSEEISQIFGRLNPNTFLGARNTALVSLLLDTGLRVSEAAGLKEEDVHLDSRYLKVMGKGAKERMVSFGVSCQRTLIQYYHDFRPEPAHPGVDTFFLAVDGLPMTTTALQLVIKRLAKSSGVNRLYPHLLRHTYATLFLINGGDVFLLQQNLGHTSLEMVGRYVHLASRTAAVRSQSFSPLDRLEVKEVRRFRHNFSPGEGTASQRNPQAGRGKNPRKKASGPGRGGRTTRGGVS